MTHRKIPYWVIPPEANAACVAHRENVLDTYALPPHAQVPVMGMDEPPVQLLKETRVPIAATNAHAQRVDYEDERAGTASIFMLTAPLSGWRTVRGRQQRTTVDWAIEMAALLRTRYATAEKVIVGCDTLNTHTMGAFYEAFAPEKARELGRRIAFRSPPKHGSWLNIADNELRSLTRQCLKDRRLRDIATLQTEASAWETHSNTKQHGVNWPCKIKDARTKLKSLYPKIVN
jgi:hypothetical protein